MSIFMRKFMFVVAVFITTLIASPAFASGLSIYNADTSGEGFNDATSTPAIGGNTGTTIGEQRLNVFNQAADILNATFDIAVTVVVNANFDPLYCTSSSAILGSAGPDDYTFQYDSDIANYILYPDALANQLMGSDANTSTLEIGATFNSNLGNTNCLDGYGWYLGYDAPTGSLNSLLSVVLHEIMHGMGFLSLLQSDGSAGATYGSADVFSNYSLLLYDASQGTAVASLSQSQRAAAMLNDGNLLWDGAQTNAQLSSLSAGVNGSRMQMYAPASYESGSSVSHFDTDATPNEIMEPMYTEFLQDAGLAKYLLADIGWTLAGSSNTAPVLATVSNQSMNEDDTLDIILSATDADGDTLSYSLLSADSNFGASISGTTLSFAPSADYYGSGSVSVQVSDGSDSDSTTFTLTVNAVNDAPLFTSGNTYSVNEDDTLTVTLAASDVDDSTLTFALLAHDSAAVTASLSGSTLTVIPVSGVTGTTTIDVSVTDGSDITSATLTVNVLSASNQAPVWNALSALTMLAGTTETISLNAADPDGDALTYTATATSAGLYASVSGTALSVSASGDMDGSGVISLSVTDGLLTDTTVLNVTVLPAFNLKSNDHDFANNSTLTIAHDALIFALSGGDNTLTTSVFFDGSNRDDLLTYNANSGDYTLTMPAAGAFAGTYTLTVTDSNGYSSTYYVERPMRITANVSPLLITASGSQQVIFEGAPAGSLISLNSSASALSFADQSGTGITSINAGNDATDYYAASVTLLADNNTAFVTTLTASATNVPDSTSDLDFTLPHLFVITVTDVNGTTIEGATVNTDDERFAIWGLTSSALTDDNGDASLTLPEDDISVLISADGYQNKTVSLSSADNAATVMLSESAQAFTLSGIVQASGFNFLTESPLLRLYFTNGSSEQLTLTAINGTTMRYIWNGDLSLTVPSHLSVYHSETSQVNLPVNSSTATQTLNVSLIKASAGSGTTTITVSSSSSGGGGLWYLILVLAISLVLTKRLR